MGHRLNLLHTCTCFKGIGSWLSSIVYGKSHFQKVEQRVGKKPQRCCAVKKRAVDVALNNFTQHAVEKNILIKIMSAREHVLRKCVSEMAFKRCCRKARFS